jgi:hypothetical protein
MKFILTIDTEADNQWDHGRKLTVENIKFVPRFQDLCEKYQIKPTYLVTSEICKDAFAREIFTEYRLKGKAEIGAHLHAWSTPPFLDEDGYRYNDKNHAFANELSVDLLSEKIKNLTNQIETSFGQRPTSFRSGRYGFNENVASVLIANNYIVDSSVTPYISWSQKMGIPDGIGGPDFFDKKPLPYKYSNEGKYLQEIPVTILPTRFPLNKNFNFSDLFFRNVDNNLLLKVVRRLIFRHQPLWLRPFEFMNIKLFAEIINEARRTNLPYIVMMFHSSELMPGCSDYRKDKESIEKLYDLLEDFFVLLNKKNIGSVTLSEAARNLSL